MRKLLTLLAILVSTSAYGQGTLTTLYSFRGTPFDSWQPYAAITIGPDGAFYGVTRAGGPSFFGTVYRLTQAGEHHILYSFGGPDGSQPRGRLALGDDGNFYGTTYVGGASNAGTVFRITPAGVLTTLHHFGGAVGGANPVGGLLLGRDGNFYGTTSGDNFGTGGTIYRITPAGGFATLQTVAGRPHGALIQDAIGNLYGTSISSGAFRLSVLGVLTTFPVETAVGEGVLTFGPDGALYGTTINSVYRLTPAGVATTLYRFSGGVDGQQPLAGLTLARDGFLYGTTVFGGTLLHGTLFRISPGGQFESLHNFGTADFDGWIPRAELVELPDGTLIGTASEGGQFASGTIYAYTPNGTVSGKALGEPCSRPGGCTTGNTIDVPTGNKFTRATDAATANDGTTAGADVLGFNRYYNAMAGSGPAAFAHSLGVNWRHSFDRFLRVSSAALVSAERADGRIVDFSLAGGTWRPDTDIDLRLAQLNATTWTLTDRDDAVETYRVVAGGKAILTEAKARNGYAHTLVYDATNVLQAVNDSFGRSLTLTYANGLLQSVTSPDGLVVSYGFSASAGTLDRLATVTYSTAPVSTLSYVYEDGRFPFALTGIIDENGERHATWTYDDKGRAVSDERGGGADRTTVAYNDADGSRTVTNALGLQMVYRFTTLQGVPKLTRVERVATALTAAAARTFAFDANGFLASQTDWNGNRTTYVNDNRGLPTRITEAEGTAVARTTIFTYDATFHLPVQMAQAGVRTDFTYDGDGNLLTRTETDTTTTTVPYATGGTRRTWAFTWTRGKLETAKSPRTNITAVTSFVYDGSGALVSVTNALGQTAQVTQHTPGGLPLTIVDANGVTTELTYDARSRLTTATILTADGPITTRYSYDLAGNLITVTFPDGSSLTSDYDGAHRLARTTDLFNQARGYALDALGNRLRTDIEDAGGVVVRTQRATFDALGRTVTDTGGVGQTNRYTYDDNGNSLTMLDPLGRLTRRAFDPLHRLVRVTDPAGGDAEVDYDPLDRPLSVRAPNGTLTTFAYDGFGRRIQEVSPDRGKTVYRYDLAGNVTQMVDARGAVTNNLYDPLDRISATIYPAAPAENVTYRYDEAGHGFGIGRLTSLTDAVGLLNRSYDERGNIIGETRIRGAVTLTTGYTYDGANRQTAISYPSGGKVDYVRDVMGRVTSVAFTPTAGPHLTVASGITYLPFGPVVALTFGNGIAETRRYDADYRLTEVGAVGMAPMQALTYAYDAANNVRSILDGVTALNSQLFGYDTLNRLTTATGGYGALAYLYDPNGNRLSQNVNGTVTTYTYGAGSNRLTQVRTGAALQVLAYTPNGNITTVAEFPKTRPNLGIAYNQAGQLGRVLSDAAVTMQNSYDAFGQRLFRTGAVTGTTLFQYDLEGHLLEDSDGLGHGRVDYLYLGDRPLANFQLGFNKLSFLHVDHLGTPKLATDPTQVVAWRGDAEPFGTTNVTVSLSSQNLRFPGQEFEPDTGWHHNGFRDYVPALGRYLQSDPIGLAGGMSPYSYGLSSPIVNSDSRGLFVFLFFAGPSIASAVGDLALFGSLAWATQLNSPPPLALPNHVFNAPPANETPTPTPKPDSKQIGPCPTPEELIGKTPDEVKQLLEERGWRAEDSNRGDGERYPSPTTKGQQVRVMPGYPNSDIPVKQGPYAVISSSHGAPVRVPSRWQSDFARALRSGRDDVN